jgi:hypothetical protein
MAKHTWRWKRGEKGSLRGKSQYSTNSNGDPYARDFDDRNDPHKPQYHIRKGVVGFVERVNGKETGQDFQKKRLVVGYFEAMTVENGCLRTVFSDVYPMYVFDVETGEISNSGEKDQVGNYVMNFPKKPAAPEIHQTWRSDDPQNPDKAFEPHTKKVLKHRTIEMMREGRPEKEIDDYVSKGEEFMELAEALFATDGNVLEQFKEGNGITIRRENT